MKIAWFTPFSQKSAIAKYSRSVTQELAEYCDVDLWIVEDEQVLLTDLNLVRYLPGSDLSSRLRDYDHVVYNMGNYLPYHKDIYEVSMATKGIVILHDFVMHHFFTGFYFLYRNDADAYVRDMEVLYGQEGKMKAIRSLKGTGKPIWESDEVMSYPFFERVIEGALGVIVHSKFHGRAVRQKYMGPVGVLYHPFYSRDGITVSKGTQKPLLGVQGDKVLLITVGHVNPNKKIDRIIQALGRNKEIAEKVTYVIIGSFEHRDYFSYLKSLVEQYSLMGSVKFMGYQPDDILYSYMSAADGFMNLRFPALEGASWSLVEELHFGKPIVVSDTGWYRELPDQCVLKIRPKHEEDDILQVLRKFAYKDLGIAKVGINGQKFAVNTFTASKYCDGFLKFLDVVNSWRPILGLIDRVSLELSVMGGSVDSPCISMVASEISEFFR